MKMLFLTAALSLSSLALAAPWEIDPAHASANFSVKHMMVTSVNGHLGEVTGKVDLDEKDLTKSTVEATIDVKGLSTRNQKRDDHLRSPDFFDVEKFPTITFKSKSVAKGEGSKLKVTGDLTIRGVTKSVTLDGELTNAVASPFGPFKVRGFSATTQVNRKDFGLVWNKSIEAGGVLVGDDVKITIEAELMTKPAAAAPAKKG